MNLIKIKCAFCGKNFLRPAGRANEAKKFDWNQYCSKKCQNKARLRRIEKICSNPDCSKNVSRELGQFKRSKSGWIFCSRSCAVSFNNSEFPKRKKKIKKCNYCNKEFSGNKKYCSKECKDRAQIINEKELLQQIRRFYQKNKRIPLKRESSHYGAIRSRFGAWNKAIEAAGFKPNPILFAKKCIANDGHKCDSLAEKIIDDWFYARKIKHERKIPYPDDKSLTVDFVIKNKWIEFFGLVGAIKRYDQLIQKKRRISKKHDLSLIEIYPKDLFPINRLEEIIKIL